MTHHPDPAAAPLDAARPEPLPFAEATSLAASVLDQVDRAVVGKREALTLVLAGVLAGGHVLLEDLPGLGKTLAARSLAQALGLEFRRAQFTPDLLPSDLTGSYVFDQTRAEFNFRPGPVFTGLLLADEINRTPPKTQSALLEAMQEHQVSVEGTTFPLPRPFHVIATANPIEHEGTYPLPEAQLDRFLLRLSFGYPTPDEEWEVLSRRIARKQEDQHLAPVLDAARLLALQASAEEVYVAESVGRYAIALVDATRRDSAALVGASPRGSLALLTCSRALALIRGRSFVVPEDVKDLAPAALGHRITVRPELWLNDVSPESIVTRALDAVPVPDASDLSPANAAR
ncbi:MAG TPA: MoxR family ATPase [Propionibacteriaceae bacterium]|nr:MoxR family ATPase [Propionibacteriaceae bacterium]